MMKNKEKRNELSNIDKELAQLLEKRLRLTGRAETNSILLRGSGSGERRGAAVSSLTKSMDEEMAIYTKVLFQTLYDLEDSYRNKEVYLHSEKAEAIREGIRSTSEFFPKRATVACQGIEGSNSQLACEKMFQIPDITFLNTFEAVFSAVDKGLCRYGILPIENSLNGSVGEVYELMKKYRLYIVRSTKMQINHALLGVKGASPQTVKIVHSHEQALGQCSDYLKEHPGMMAQPAENTAIAAKIVSDLGNPKEAAISNRLCADLYGLTVLEDGIQNNDNNYTRFICISKKMEIYPGADKTSLMFTTPNKPGALYEVLSKFAALGVNMTKLESRPIPGKDFEFMFHLDLDSSVLQEEILNLICELEQEPDSFTFLGSYREI